MKLFSFPLASLEKAINKRMLSLPLYTSMSDDEQGRVIGALRGVLGG